MTDTHVKNHGSIGNSIRSGKCILMCAGEFTPLEIEVGDDDIVIAVDAGLKYLEMLGIVPDYMIGDFDSIDGSMSDLMSEFRENRPDRVIELPVEKDDTDSLYALKFGLKLGYTRFDLYGAMGRRLDHTIANIQTLIYAKSMGAEAYMFDEKCMVFAMFGGETKRFSKGMTGMLALFAVSDSCTGVTETGLHYGLDNYTLSNSFPIGMSNEFDPSADDGEGHGATITIGSGRALVIVTYEVEKKYLM